MHNMQAIGMIEFNSIAAGIEAADAMLKAASVEVLLVKTICPGKFLAGVYSDVASVQASLEAGLALGQTAALDSFVIPNISQAVVRGIGCALDAARGAALGVIETFSACSCIEAADVAVKTASVDLVEVRLAMGLGGKAYCLLCGDVAAVRAATQSGAQKAGDNGLLVQSRVIPSLSPELLPYLI